MHTRYLILFVANESGDFCSLQNVHMYVLNNVGDKPSSSRKDSNRQDATLVSQKNCISIVWLDKIEELQCIKNVNETICVCL